MNLIAMLKELRDAAKMQLDEMLVLITQAKAVRAEYAAFEVDQPTWLTDAIDILESTIKARTRENLMARLRQVQQEAGGLMSRDEKRAQLAAAEARLRTQLGLKDEPVPAGS